MSVSRAINLHKDPLYIKEVSAVQLLKHKELERKRQNRHKRQNPQASQSQPKIILEDLLSQELSMYKEETKFKKISQNSKARDSLRKYIVEQERNLKCLRVERDMSQNGSLIHKRSKSLQLHLAMSHSEGQPFDKQIQIPRVQDIFKDQEHELMLFESRSLGKRISRAIHSIDLNVIKSKAFSQFNQDVSMLAKVLEDGDDMVIDQVISRKLERSASLQKKLRDQRTQMERSQEERREVESGSSFMPGLLTRIMNVKKVPLEGVKKSHTVKARNKSVRVTPASGLLFELNKLSNGRERKEEQLSSLLKSSFQNRQVTLQQKSNFYDTESTIMQLTPSSQFKLRHLMDKKLAHRLHLSKEQVNKFASYLREIKEHYHVILNDTILQILKQIRLVLMQGRVMKARDFDLVIRGQPQQHLRQYPNQLIISKLRDLMV